MPIHIRTDAAYQQARLAWVRDISAWRQIIKAWVRDAVAWQLTYVLATPVTPSGAGGTYQSQAEGPAVTTLTLRTDGSLQVTALAGGVSGQWLTPVTAGAGPAYWVRFTGPTGVGYSNDAAAWRKVDADLSYQVSSSGTASADGPLRVASVLVEISASSGGTVLASGTYNLRAQGLRII